MNAPKIENAPGLTWRPRKWGWEARWRARTDLVRRGYRPAVVRLWLPSATDRELTDTLRSFISDRCQALQDEMLVWGRGGIQVVPLYDGSIKGLIAAYQTDQDSSYRKLRYHTRENYDGLLRRVDRDRGHEMIAEIKARHLLRWHE